MPTPSEQRPLGWRARLQRWFWARLPQRDSTELRQNNLYILPTGAGWLLLATLLALLIASINYQLNLGYLLTFLLAGCAAISVPMTHNTLRGLQLHMRPPAPQFVDRPVLLGIQIQNPGKRQRLGVGLRLQDLAAPPDKAHTGMDSLNWHDCPRQSGQTVQLAWNGPARGWHTLPAVHIETRFPMGIFRVWSIWRPASQVLLYPAPEVPAPPLPMQGGGARFEETPSASALLVSRSDEIPEDIRPYQRGDSPRHIVWKKVAQTGELVSRESRRPDSRSLWLDFDDAAPQRGAEPALQRLCAWVQLAHAQDQRFGLRLPPTSGQAELRVGPDRGEAHLQRCLQALAEWGLHRPPQPHSQGKAHPDATWHPQEAA
ncbi:MAG: DUF58 domain-containing protein [Brachymonas sp.]|nr:DUF58 domain-containing protein [Brachymonas sp.]